MSQVLQEEEVFSLNSSDMVEYEQHRNIFANARQVFSCIMIIIFLWNVSKHKIYHCKQIVVFKTAEMA
jgi:hypothetical protein